MDQQTLENEAINEFDIINENEIITENNSVDGTMAEVKMPSGVAVKYKRQYDIIVFGASGCIGKHVVKAMDYFSQIYGVTWAVAGRSVEKLQYVLDELYKTRGEIFVVFTLFLYWWFNILLQWLSFFKER